MTEYCRAISVEDFGAIVAAERGRLVRLCSYLTGTSQAAEDLAQETLAEAWRQRHKVYDIDGMGRWLSVIARNVCLRWAERWNRDRARLVPQNDDTNGVPADFDLDVALERDDLATLLDQAMAHLPKQTQRALVECYVNGSSQVQVALRLGVSEGAVAMRLRRGRLALRRILASELREPAAEYGLAGVGAGGWEDSCIWCPVCGRHRLQARFIPTTGALTVRCPGCTPEPGTQISQATMPLLHRETTSARAGVARLLDWMHTAYYGRAPTGTVLCQWCERPTPPAVVVARWSQGPQLRYSVETACAACGHRDRMWLSGIALALPAGRAFWRAHGRVRLLPERPVESDGHPAAVIGMEAVASTARFELVTALPTLAVIGGNGGDRDDVCDSPELPYRNHFPG